MNQQDSSFSHCSYGANYNTCFRRNFRGLDLSWSRFSVVHSLSQSSLLRLFLWKYLNSLVFADRPRIFVEQKENIREPIANTPYASVERIDRHTVKLEYVANGKRHLLDTIFKRI
ncbi:hypothetical protein TNCV_2617541 [Trichonephila clavipes]|nr:hypothetical protein TNCV_2617541 [Trichonephila clavipes]